VESTIAVQGPRRPTPYTVKGGWSSKDRDECEPEPAPSYFEAHITFEMKPLLYARNIGEHDEQDILNLALVLFHLSNQV
jgi:hypothetical protein